MRKLNGTEMYRARVFQPKQMDARRSHLACETTGTCRPSVKTLALTLKHSLTDHWPFTSAINVEADIHWSPVSNVKSQRQ